MKKLVIIGASSWGIEIFSWLKNAQGFEKEWIFKGFLDDEKKDLSHIPFCPYPILATIDAYEPAQNDVFICAVGTPKDKKSVIERLQRNGQLEFINVIHQSVIIFPDVKLGHGIVLAPNVVISNSVKVGNHVAINIATSVGHNVEIADYCQISSNCDLTGFVRLGNEVFLGSSVTIIPHVEIGNQTSVGAGSVVLKKVGEGVTLFGNPAKVIL